MNADDMKELKELIEFLKDNKIGEFDLERGELKVRIKFAQEGGADLAGLARMVASQTAQLPAVAVPLAHAGTLPAVQAAGPESQAAATASEEESLHIVKSPFVGTFYESP